MSKKKGFMHYIANPGEAAKKIFPFIDVDAMMEDNRKRYEALGVDPEQGKNLMGFALNPGGYGLGLGLSATGKVITPLARTLAKSEKLPFAKAWKAHQRKTLEKDLLSDAGFNRYRSNAISETKHTLDESKNVLDMLDNPVALKVFGKKDLARRKKMGRKSIKNLEKELDFMRLEGKHGFQDQYMRQVKKSIADTPLNVGYPTPKGYIRGWSGYYNPPSKKAFVDEINVFRPRFKGTGVHELKHAAQDQAGNLTTKGWRQKIDRLLDKTRIEDKMGIPTEYAGRAQAKLMDAVNPRPPYQLSRKEFWDYLATPEEVSARLSQFRTQPKFIKWLGEKNIYKPPYWKQLDAVFPKTNIKDIADKAWSLAPGVSAGLMGQAIKEN